MTREEAILLLHDMKDTYDEIHESTNYEIGYEQMTALDMAIEALSEPSKVDFRTDESANIGTEVNDLISRADAIEAVAEEWLSEASAESPYVNDDDIGAYKKLAEELFADIPSADAESDDLIIKGAKGIHDGLYNIKDGKLFMYKDNGGTVRTYPIVPSADADDRLYIKVYADDEPSVKAEKLYQICGETENRETAEWLKEYFPSADIPTEDYSDLPDIPRAYYEKIVGNMAHEINMLKEQLESADAVPKMTEEVREALMRLTMCAREECDMCKYKDECGFDFQYNISTENMHTILAALQADAVSREEYDKLIQELNDSPKGKWIPLDGKLPKIIGEHVLVTIKWADDDLEVCEMCPTVADRYNIIAFQDLPEPYQGEQIKSELQCSGARMKGGAE